MKFLSGTSPTGRRLIRYKEVCHRTALSKTTVWRRSRDGKFPKPISLSDGIVAWLEDEVDAWLQMRIAARDAQDRAQNIRTSA
jgi:prophage regulatory protein